MAKNAAHEAAKKRATKEKKMLVVLALVLVVALGYAYRTLTKLNGSAAPAPTVAATTTSAPATTPAPAPSGAAATPAGSGPSGTSAHLISAVTPSLGQGQLRTFTLFASKDPFFSDGPSATGGSGSAGSSPAPPPRTTPKKTPVRKSLKLAVAPLSSAVISVNGTEGLVSLDGVFPTTGDPATDGLFRLVALTRTTAKVGIVGGSFASGAATLTLHVGKPVTLADTSDGQRFTLELYPQGTVPSAQPPPGTSTTTTPATLSTPPSS